MSDSRNSSGIGCLTVLGLIFITLKLTGHVAWSWWWVLAPFWGPWALVAVLLFLAGLFELPGAIRRSRKRAY